MVIWRTFCGCSIFVACILIAIFGALACIFRIILDVTIAIEITWISREMDAITAYIEEHNIDARPVDVVKFLDLVVIDAYVDLIVASFESFAYLCVLIGAQDKSEKLLLPALVIFPINCIIKFIFIAIIFSFGALGTYNAIGITLFLLNILHAFIYVPKWIAIYSLRQELLGNDSRSESGGPNLRVLYQTLCLFR